MTKWFIVQYEKGIPGCKRVENIRGNTILFKTKRDAMKRVESMTYSGMSFIYKVYKTGACCEGECSICLKLDCPMKGD